MTGLLHEKSFSRKSFIKGGGAMIVGFSLAGCARGQGAAAGRCVCQHLPPVTSQVDSWLTINADNTIVDLRRQGRARTGLDDRAAARSRPRS